MLTLYFATGSSSMAVHIELHEIGVAFEGKPMSFKKNDMRSPEYLALNPEGKVPTLVIDGRPLTDDAAVQIYRDRRLPDASQIARAPCKARAQISAGAASFENKPHPARRHGRDQATDV